MLGPGQLFREEACSDYLAAVSRSVACRISGLGYANELEMGVIGQAAFHEISLLSVHC